MPNPQILPGQSIICGVGGLAADQITVLPLSSLTATIDNYTAAFVAGISPPGGVNTQAAINVVPKLVPAGQTVTVTVTCHGKNQAGQDLPPTSQSFDLIGGPVAPQDASIQIVLGVPGTFYATASTDPGSDTVTLI